MQTCHAANLSGISATHRKGEFLSQLSSEVLREFEMLEHTVTYPEKTTLFMEMDAPGGIFVLLEGRIKLSINSREGKRLIVGIAEAGDLLDMSAAFAGTPHQMTAETLHCCKAAFIRRDDFLHFVLAHPDVYQGLAREISKNYQKACEKLRSVVLSSSVPERLARLLLEWCNTGQVTECGTRVKISMTHEEIGECIGTSRESVTRTLSDFKHRKLVMLQGSTLMISDRVALEDFARA